MFCKAGGGDFSSPAKGGEPISQEAEAREEVHPVGVGVGG